MRRVAHISSVSGERRKIDIREFRSTGTEHAFIEEPKSIDSRTTCSRAVQRQKPAVNRERIALASVQTAMRTSGTLGVHSADTGRVRFESVVAI
jgi:hypothetical protein